MITLQKDGLRVELCEIGEYYRGTRFDHAGVFRRIVRTNNGTPFIWADEWFDHQDPFRHDRVCGLSEEFVTVNLEGVPAGGLFCKPGVGLLRRPDDAPYDWFRLYEIAEPGMWETEAKEAEAVYRHSLKGWYRYEKTIRLTSGSSLEILHSLIWENPQPLDGFFYNHNFFTFNGKPVGPDRRIFTAWPPAGNWRNAYTNVRFAEDGVEFLGPVDPANSVYCGDMHSSIGPTVYSFGLQDGSERVDISSDTPLDHIVLWSNPRVACMEPYLRLSLQKEQQAQWVFRYRFSG